MPASRSTSRKPRTGTPPPPCWPGAGTSRWSREARRPPPSPGTPPPRLRDRLDGAAADALERAQARGSAGLIANTAAHGAVIARAYGLSGRQPEAVIGLSLPPEITAAARGASYPDETGPVRLLFVGRAEARKGFDALLGAIAILADEAERGAGPPFRLDLIGVPPEDLPGDLPEAARARIHARGRVPAGALAQAYAEAHAVLAPSRYESFGLVYQEALAYGRPVVACAADASARAFVGAPGAGPLAPGGHRRGPGGGPAPAPRRSGSARAPTGAGRWRRPAASPGRSWRARPSTSTPAPSRRPGPRPARARASGASVPVGAQQRGFLLGAPVPGREALVAPRARQDVGPVEMVLDRPVQGDEAARPAAVEHRPLVHAAGIAHGPAVQPVLDVRVDVREAGRRRGSGAPIRSRRRPPPRPGPPAPAAAGRPRRTRVSSASSCSIQGWRARS